MSAEDLEGKVAEIAAQVKEHERRHQETAQAVSELRHLHDTLAAAVVETERILRQSQEEGLREARTLFAEGLREVRDDFQEGLNAVDKHLSEQDEKIDRMLNHWPTGATMAVTSATTLVVLLLVNYLTHILHL